MVYLVPLPALSMWHPLGLVCWAHSSFARIVVVANVGPLLGSALFLCISLARQTWPVEYFSGKLLTSLRLVALFQALLFPYLSCVASERALPGASSVPAGPSSFLEFLKYFLKVPSRKIFTP